MKKKWHKADHIFSVPRYWSNEELRKVAHLFEGDIVNVSGWKDEDKEGGFYKDYFSSKSPYSITNFKSDMRGFQGSENEIFLNLTEELPQELVNRFDVVFNHTVLEHIYEVQKAFGNLCQMSKDVVIVVVPFLQKMHSDYGDFWRFTPSAIKRMYEDNGLEMVYSSFNSHDFASTYLFAIGCKNPEKWKSKLGNEFSFEDRKRIVNNENLVGVHAVQNANTSSLLRFFKLFVKRKF